MAKIYDIFISYASADETLATDVTKRLTQNGFTVIAPSADYGPTTPSKALDQIKESSMAIYIASRHSNKLRKSVNEILQAARDCKALFIIVTDDSTFPTAIPRPTIYRLPTIDFRRDLPRPVLLDRLTMTVTQVFRTGSPYTEEQLRELDDIKDESTKAKALLVDNDCHGASQIFTNVIERLEQLPCYPPTLLAHAYSDLAEAHYKCHNYRKMYDADERALALIAAEDFSASRDINYRLAVAVSHMDNPSHEQLTEALSHIEAAIYDHSFTDPTDTAKSTEMEYIRNELASRLAI